MAQITYWGFDDTTARDTSAANGAQDGTLQNGATTSGGRLQLDGANDYVEVAADPVFQLDTGTLITEFTADTLHNGTIFARDSLNNDDGGHFYLRVRADGSVDTRAQSATTNYSQTTGAGFYAAGDDLRVTYSWNAGTGGTFTVENLTQATSFTQAVDPAVTFDQGSFNEPITIGANQNQSSDNTADNLQDYFDGSIDYVSLFDSPETFASSGLDGDGIVTGTSGADAIDSGYLGDPDGERVDAGDGIYGTTGDQDIILGRGGDDTITAGAANDTINAGMDNDSVSGGDGDDVIFGDVAVDGPLGANVTPLQLDIANLRAGSQTADPDSAVEGESVIYDNVAFLDDGTPVSAIVTLVSRTNADLAVDLTGLAGAELITNRTNNAAMEGESATFTVDFIDAATGAPLVLSGRATWGDIDEAVGGAEAITISEETFVGYEIGEPNQLDLSTANGDVTATGASGGVNLNPSDQTAWFTGIFENQSSITFTATSRGANSGFSLNGDVIDNPTTTLFAQGDDTLMGDAGDDLIFGNDGDDVIDGGTGNDTGSGGAGGDTLRGGDGADSLSGDAGNDVLIGNDDITGRAAGAADPSLGDVLAGGTGNDTIFANGSDTVDGGEDTDGSDIDVLNVADVASVQYTDSAGNPVTGPTEQGTVTFNDGSTLDFTNIETLTVNPRDGYVEGTGGDDVIDTGYTGDPDGDDIDAGDAIFLGDAPDDDIVLAGGGDDTVASGAGNDTVYGDNSVAAANPDGSGGNAALDPWVYEYYDLDPTGDPRTLADAGFTANGGRDNTNTLTTTGNSDTILPADYDTGDDYALKFTTELIIDQGGTYTFETASDDGSQLFIDGQLVVDNDGHHAVITQTGSIDLGPGPHTVEIVFYENDGGNFLSSNIAGPDTGGVTTDLEDYPALLNPTENTGSGDDVLDGGAGDDLVYGQGGDDRLVLSPGFGNDTLVGGETGETDGDTLDAGALNADAVVTFTANETGTATSNGDTATFSEIEQIVTGTGDDTVTANVTSDGIVAQTGAGTDSVSGGTGDDVVDSGADNDRVITRAGEDYVEAGAGDDFVNAGGNNDTVLGGDGNDTLSGGGGADTLYGGDGADRVLGGGGSDVLTGGGPASVEFNTTGTDGLANAGPITDFPTDALSFEIRFSAEADTANGSTLVSYATPGSNNEFLVIVQGTTVDVFVNGSVYDTGIPASDLYDGTSHSFGVTWDSATGTLVTYVDGVVRDTGTVAAGQTLEKGGTLVFGQEQDSVGGGFNTNQIFEGRIEEARLWDDVRTPDEIATFEGDTLGTEIANPNLVSDWLPGADGASLDDLAGPYDAPLTGNAFVAENPADGNDTLIGGNGADTVLGDGGDDTIVLNDTHGNDSLRGGETGETDGDVVDATAMTVDATVTFSANEAGNLASTGGTATFAEIERFKLGSGDDTVDASVTSQGVNVLAGGGNDSLQGGSGDDTLAGDSGDDAFVLANGHGADSLTGGEDGELSGDLLDAMGVTADAALFFSGNETGTFASGGDTAEFAEIERVDLGSGDDTTDATATTQGVDVSAGGGDDTLAGGTGADTLDGDAGDDTFTLGDTFGDDSLTGGETGETTGDTLDASGMTQDAVLDFDGDENGTISASGDSATFTEIEQFTLGGGDDVVDATATSAGVNVDAGAGSDTLASGAGADTLAGGDDADTFTFTDGSAAAGDVIDGGTGGDDNDTLDLTGTLAPGETYLLIEDGPDSDGNGTDGRVEYYDATGVLTGTLTFSNIENIVPCFTTGTRIATPRGGLPVEDLRVGDMVKTRDGGLQAIRWIGRKLLSADALRANPHLRPIRVAKGALGPNCPTRDLIVSPQHRFLVDNVQVQLNFGESEMLVAAKHMLDLPGVDIAGNADVTYFHIMFDDHQIVLSEGAWTESFQPGAQTLPGLDDGPRAELETLFPDLFSDQPAPYPAARATLRSFEAKLALCA
ncbi:Hint domain-containing protein [Sulfitobacter sp. S190]|uniref:Hint domain-containing protein n=1 Tax=Sulfitobacter sp. S190 TaxID=2867022 RepID=UPI0021A7FADE|nr:Hint domain-containing protein [Sulfitobacter sp. S190]UWR23342.1 Hint domain-containing protein [Sulfitobacter sp. S190]